MMKTALFRKRSSPPTASAPAQLAFGRPAFTLVELLVVISIIVLLVAILVPVVQSAILAAEEARTEARVAELANGCTSFQINSGFFPGQQEIDKIGPVEQKKKTGSQFLAEALAPAGYAKFASDDLIDVSGQEADGSPIALLGSISDRSSEPMAILYYPAKLGVKGLGQYDINHNIEYVRGYGDPGAFGLFITDGRMSQPGNPQPYTPQKFLLIAPGKDKIYFSEDVTYPPW